MKLEINAKRRYLNVPAQFEVCAGEQAAHACIAQAARSFAVAPPRVAIVSGKRRTAEIARRIQLGIRSDCTTIQQIVLGGCTLEHVQESARALAGTTDMLIAVGGGSVIDPVKLISGDLDIPLIVVPTALSSDCIGSPISVLHDASGKKTSFPSVIPSFVVVDTAITTAAPQSMAVAGLCDVLSNASAVLDARDAQNNAGYKLDNFALALSEGAYRLLVPVDWSSFHAHAGHETLVKALILSGLAMGFSGDSVPCSGAEHAISHAIDFMYPGSSAHGLQVGVTTVYCHYLRQCLDKEGISPSVIEALQQMRPPLHPMAIGLSRARFLAAVAMGREIRPARYTILNQLKQTSALEEAYDAAFNG